MMLVDMVGVYLYCYNGVNINIILVIFRVAGWLAGWLAAAAADVLLYYYYLFCHHRRCCIEDSCAIFKSYFSL